MKSEKFRKGFALTHFKWMVKSFGWTLPGTDYNRNRPWKGQKKWTMNNSKHLSLMTLQRLLLPKNIARSSDYSLSINYNASDCASRDILVPVTGLEPVRCCHRGILSPLRLPISPHRHREVWAGITTPTQNYRWYYIALSSVCQPKTAYFNNYVINKI